MQNIHIIHNIHNIHNIQNIGNIRNIQTIQAIIDYIKYIDTILNIMPQIINEIDINNISIINNNIQSNIYYLNLLVNKFKTIEKK